MPSKSSMETGVPSLFLQAKMNRLFHGIVCSLPHLDRAKLLLEVETLVLRHQFVVFSTPAGSGKTSMFQLFRHKYPSTKFSYIQCTEEKSLADFLREEAEIDLQKETCPAQSERSQIVFIDDADLTYWDKANWRLLIKNLWLRDKPLIRFIISANHMLSGDPSRPVELQYIKDGAGLTMKDFLLSDAEAEEFLTLPKDVGLPAEWHHFSELKRIIIQQCAGLVGALRLSINFLTAQFSNPHLPEFTEEHLIRCYLSIMPTIFGGHHLRPVGMKTKEFLAKMLSVKSFIGARPVGLDENDTECFLNLQKAGILKEGSTEFSSPLARRFFVNTLFPLRLGRLLPESLFDLIRESIKSMSASQLAQSTVNSEDFPKEATFQHFLMMALAECTPMSCVICPELSKIFPDADDSSPGGEADFFLNGDIRCGIQLLVNGDGAKEHLDRFDPNKGKYSALNAKDYAVIDFRASEDGEAVNLKVQHNKRVTVFFKRGGDFKRCQCLFGDQKTPVCLTLKP